MVQIHCAVEQPEMIALEKIIDEAEGFKTLVFRGQLNAKPGQFVMVWIPGVEMKPFSISYQDEREFHITVMEVGEFTKAMFALRKGDRVGIQGPYGRPFTMNNGESVLIIGGGCGIAPVNFLAYEAVSRGKKVCFIGGCRNKEVFIKAAEIKALPVEAIFTTDDGSFGEKGFTTNALKKVLENRIVDQMFACGPEKMLHAIATIAIAKKIPCQISVERMMKCAIGICGQCCLDDTGVRVCREGPVFEAKTILNSKEFGSYKRDNRGVICNL